MLLISADRSPLSLDKVMLNPYQRIEISGKVQNPAQSLSLKYSNNKEQHTIEYRYPRYWHGYIIWLRPLLTIIDYSKIRFIIKCSFYGLSALIICLLIISHYKRYVPAFILFLCSLSPSAIVQSLQFSTVVLISLFFSTIAILFGPRIVSKPISFFLLAGICTSYFDLLSCPVLTLGLPLSFILLCSADKFPVFSSWKLSIQASTAWVCGYFGMWLGKWLLATTFTKHNIFIDAIHQILQRSSLENFGDTSFSYYLDVLIKNISLYIEGSHDIFYLTLSTFVITVAVMAWQKNSMLLKGLGRVAIVLLLPFGWCLFASNHSYVHYWFTYRNFSLCLFPILCLIGDVYLKRKSY